MKRNAMLLEIGEPVDKGIVGRRESMTAEVAHSK